MSNKPTVRETVSYAQNREDLILAGFFDEDEKGFYVDVGANHPSRDSVTKLFYDQGWHGINIEPLQSHYEQLQQERPRDTNLNVGVGAKDGEVTLREYTLGTGLSTMSDHMKQEYLTGANDAAVEYIDHTVPVHTLAKIFEEQKATHISFMKVDVEGYEYDVLASNDWKKFRPEVLCVEANHIENDWHPILREHDYTLAFFDGLNEYFVDAHKPERLKKFSFVDAIVNREPIVMYRLLPKVEEHAQLKQRVAELEKEVELKNQQVTSLERFIAEVTPLRRHVRRQVKHRLRATDQKIINKLGAVQSYTPMTVDSDHKDTLESLFRADQANFATYNQAVRRTSSQKAYLTVRRAGIQAATKLLRMGKV